jgi:hypothetical protein
MQLIIKSDYGFTSLGPRRTHLSGVRTSLLCPTEIDLPANDLEPNSTWSLPNRRTNRGFKTRLLHPSLCFLFTEAHHNITECIKGLYVHCFKTCCFSLYKRPALHVTTLIKALRHFLFTTNIKSPVCSSTSKAFL